jgi:hypothetical protein
VAYLDSTTASGASPTPSVAVPAGVQADNIVILVCGMDDATAVFETADWPAGFTELGEVTLTGDGQEVAVGWKRLTGADSGSYTFGSVTANPSPDWVCQAYAFSGRHKLSPPVISTIAENNAANTTPVSVTANGVTAVDGDDLLMLSVPDVRASGAANGHDAPASYVEREDAENLWANLAGFTRDGVNAGATGNITATLNLSTSSSGWAAILVRLPSEVISTFFYANKSSVPPNLRM